VQISTPWSKIHRRATQQRGSSESSAQTAWRPCRPHCQTPTHLQTAESTPCSTIRLAGMGFVLNPYALTMNIINRKLTTRPATPTAGGKSRRRRWPVFGRPQGCAPATVGRAARETGNCQMHAKSPCCAPLGARPRHSGSTNTLVSADVEKMPAHIRCGRARSHAGSPPDENAAVKRERAHRRHHLAHGEAVSQVAGRPATRLVMSVIAGTAAA